MKAKSISYGAWFRFGKMKKITLLSTFQVVGSTFKGTKNCINKLKTFIWNSFNWPAYWSTAFKKLCDNWQTESHKLFSSEWLVLWVLSIKYDHNLIFFRINLILYVRSKKVNSNTKTFILTSELFLSLFYNSFDRFFL